MDHNLELLPHWDVLKSTCVLPKFGNHIDTVSLGVLGAHDELVLIAVDSLEVQGVVELARLCGVVVVALGLVTAMLSIVVSQGLTQHLSTPVIVLATALGSHSVVLVYQPTLQSLPEYLRELAHSLVCRHEVLALVDALHRQPQVQSVLGVLAEAGVAVLHVHEPVPAYDEVVLVLALVLTQGLAQGRTRLGAVAVRSGVEVYVHHYVVHGEVRLAVNLDVCKKHVGVFDALRGQQGLEEVGGGDDEHNVGED